MSVDGTHHRFLSILRGIGYFCALLWPLRCFFLNFELLKKNAKHRVWAADLPRVRLAPYTAWPPWPLSSSLNVCLAVKLKMCIKNEEWLEKKALSCVCTLKKVSFKNYDFLSNVIQFKKQDRFKTGLKIAVRNSLWSEFF